MLRVFPIFENIKKHFRLKIENDSFLSLALCFFAVVLLAGCSGAINQPVTKGVLDLTQWDFDKSGIATLNGEWEFYWNQLLEPKDFTDHTSPSYIVLPGVWNEHEKNGTKLSGQGFATYRLIIKNSLKDEKLGLRIPYHFTAFRLWIDDELVSENGVVSDSKPTSKPQTLPEYIYFKATGNDIAITLQVSNYHFDKGGAPAPYKFGVERQIKALQSRQVALDLFLAGILFIMAFHHLGLYYLMKKEVYTLYFSIVCFLVMFRTIGLGETFLIELFPDFNFEAYTRFIFIGYFIGPPLFILFIQKLFPLDAKVIFGKVYMLIGVLFAGSLLFPASVSTKVLMPYALVLITSYIYLLYLVIKAYVRKREGSTIALIGILVIVVTVFNDILYDNNVINTGYYSPYGMVIFIFSQSFLLSLKFSNSFKAIKKLSSKIKKINIANSRFVPSEFLSFLDKESIVDVQLGDNVTKEMTVFFSDVRSFTTISESLTPEENFHFINSLLRRFGPIVRQNNGFIDKFMGDSIMALFPESPTDAIITASQILKELEFYNEGHMKKGLIPIKLGIGINSGMLMLGTIGEKQRMDGTVISDSVNIASRLEGLSKVFNANIIVSEKVLLEVKETIAIDYRFLGKVPVKGKSKSIPIYEIFSFDLEDIKILKLRIKEPFEKAIQLYEDLLFAEAKVLFTATLEIFPEDKAAKYYIDLINSNDIIDDV